MTLPVRPNKSTPIPNDPFFYPDPGTIRGPYWDYPIDGGLLLGEDGSVRLDSTPPSPPQSILYGSTGIVGVGTGLEIREDTFNIALA